MAKFKSSAPPIAPAKKRAAPKKATAGKAAPAVKKKAAAKPVAAVDAGTRGIVDSAQQIWQTSVKALGRAQQEGTRLFETLVKEGMGVEKKTRSMAAGKVNAVRDQVESRVGQVKDRANDTWDRLEKVFEERVQRALTRLGVPGREELQALIDRVDELNVRLRDLSSTPSTGSTPAAAKAPTKKIMRKPKAPAKAAVPAKPASATTKSRSSARKAAEVQPETPSSDTAASE
ncbi:phasin family protein [Xanthomonadaceae bacterium JHOS43]|nr:phasin family protein [Xanthomonadaceae bacterium JHOS43]MCX7563739.1 phasin family protein [Xanthomonadaceae bacterium XH05]